MRKIIAAVAALILVVLGGIAYASIPAADGTINGCYKNSGNHDLVVVDSAASCPSGYTALNWNQTGPQGATGATGPQGPQGEAAVTPTVRVYKTGPTSYTAGNVAQIATCPSGSALVGGGFVASGASDAFILRASRAVPDNTGGTLNALDAWAISGTATTNVDITVSAVCMTGVTPAPESDA